MDHNLDTVIKGYSMALGNPIQSSTEDEFRRDASGIIHGCCNFAHHTDSISPFDNKRTDIVDEDATSQAWYRACL